MNPTLRTEHQDSTAATSLPGRWAGVLALVYLVAATSFAIGEPFGDLTLGAALTTTALWVVPTLVLGILALRGHTWAGGLAVGAALVIVVVQSLLRVVDVDRSGPVTVIAALAAAWPVAATGLRRPGWAARAMLLLGGAMLVATALARGPRGSTLVVAVPLLLLAIPYGMAAPAHRLTALAGSAGARRLRGCPAPCRRRSR